MEVGPNPRPWVALPPASGLGMSAAPRGGWKNRLGDAVPNMSPWCRGWEGGGTSPGEILSAWCLPGALKE